VERKYRKSFKPIDQRKLILSSQAILSRLAAHVITQEEITMPSLTVFKKVFIAASAIALSLTTVSCSNSPKVGVDRCEDLYAAIKANDVSKMTEINFCNQAIAKEAKAINRSVLSKSTYPDVWYLETDSIAIACGEKYQIATTSEGAKYSINDASNFAKNGDLPSIAELTTEDIRGGWLSQIKIIASDACQQ
jgi:hypothetical protein